MNSSRKKPDFVQPILAALVVSAFYVSAAEGAEGFAVIVNLKNTSVQPESPAARALVKQLFLKQKSKWPGGETAKPYGRKKDGEVHKAFSARILEMTMAEQARHWLKMKQETGQTPPREMSSARLGIKMVAKSAGAFNVVTLKEAKDASKDVRILLTIP